jgi:hypothetical protein
MLRWLFGRRRNKSQEYLNPGRLEDVIALLQVLRLDTAIGRGANAIHRTLRDHPHSAKTWADLAANHPEFFRVYQGKGEPSISLIARYMIGNPTEE